MHRLINWKPRQFATPWTLCGMRRSLTVESRRRTCTAKHSGKCLEAISCSLSPSCLCLVRQTEGWLLLAEDFFSSLSISGFLCTVFQPLSHLSLSFTVFPPLSVIPYLTLSSHHACPENGRALKFKPSLPLCLRFHTLPFPPLLWQIEVRLNTPGCFNFIDPPPEVTKAVNCFCLRMKLCHGSR